jgi:hypothetical protein
MENQPLDITEMELFSDIFDKQLFRFREAAVSYLSRRNIC